MLPSSGDDQALAQDGGLPPVQVEPSTVFCRRSRGPLLVETTFARHSRTVVLPPSYDVGRVHAATPATPVLTEVSTSARGSMVSAEREAAETSTRTVRFASETRVVCG